MFKRNSPCLTCPFSLDLTGCYKSFIDARQAHRGKEPE